MRRHLTKTQWKRRKAVKRCLRVSFFTIITLILIMGVIYIGNDWIQRKYNVMNEYEDSEFVLNDITLENGTDIDVQLLTPNPYSRPETKLRKINGIVVHYVGNPNTSAQNNRNYFEGLKAKKNTKASSHFIIGLEGEVIQCVPMNEVAYCSNQRNDDTISIEVCHPDAEGKFNDKTYESLVQLTAYLCYMFELSKDDVIRHYDVTQKMCPIYYVNHEDAWTQFKKEVEEQCIKIENENAKNTIG